MNIAPIILAVDFSSCGAAAIPVARSLTRSCRAPLLAVHVLPGEPTARLGPFYASIQDPNVSEASRRPVPVTDAAKVAMPNGQTQQQSVRRIEPEMYWIALKMLMGDKAKYFAIVFGVSFACANIGSWGDPVQQIVHLAKQESAQMIVIGTHGRTGTRRLLMGSVAEGVVRNSSCPVVVCRDLSAPEGPRPVESRGRRTTRYS